MNCNNVRKYFYAFLDGELDVERNIEVLSHLNMCHACGIKIEGERLIQRRVKETVLKVKAPAYLEHKILRSAEERPKFLDLFKKDFLFRNKVALLSAMATVIILIVGFFIMQTILKKENVFYLAESKYHDYVTKRLDPDIKLLGTKTIIGSYQSQTGLNVTLPGIKENIHIQNIEAIVEYFQKQTGLSLTLPGFKENVQLVGASFYKSSNIKVPLVFYKVDGVPIALAIVCNTTVDLSKMKEIIVDKTMIHAGTGYCGSCQIIEWKEAENQYVMISTLQGDELIKLIRKV